jgi:hypothetical protein
MEDESNADALWRACASGAQWDGEGRKGAGKGWLRQDRLKSTARASPQIDPWSPSHD